MKHQLTNKYIADNYLKNDYYVHINDFLAAFAYYCVYQGSSDNYHLILPALQSYRLYLCNIVPNYCRTSLNIALIHADMIKELTSEKTFTGIPEIAALNATEPEFISLGDLSRNVFFHILRQIIAQPV